LDLCKIGSPVWDGGEIDRWVKESNWGLFAEVSMVEIVKRVCYEVAELE